MVSIIKNQLLKHLSRYTKNLSSDKINISTFKGEGELSNLELDENVLTELLELPSWLRLTSAWCNHITFKISWAKLKSVPITLTLDEVNVSVETCEIVRSGSGTPTAGSGIQSLSVPLGKYSFIHKVIDGITIIVNNVNIQFKSPAFVASVQMSRIRVESKTPKWVSAELKYTRLKDPIRGLILIFKELSWQTVRIEASSTKDKNLTPLRLLTNQAKCRITIKKKLSDCSVVSSRLLLILDDLLWVLTDSQLKAALHFVDSLAGLIQGSNKAIQRKKAQKKLENLPEYMSFRDQTGRPVEHPAATSQAQKYFNLYEVKETSYHFYSQRIDLHLCDDAGSGRSSHPTLRDGGALQISVTGFQVDYYPYHLAKANRVHWPKYKEASVPPLLWLDQSLNSFKESLLTLGNPNRPPNHAPLERTPNGQQQTSTPSTPTSQSGQTTSPLKRQVLDNFSKLMTSCVILRIEDFTLFRVTTSGKKQMPKEFISAQKKKKNRSGDKERFSFPPEMPTIHAEFTYFYYPGDFVFPLPPSKCFVYVNPIQVHFDVESCLWFASFGLGLHESLLKTKVADSLNSPSSSPNERSLMYMDVKLEAIMPRVIIESSHDVSLMQKDRPKSMQVQVSRFAITNIREMGASRADLAQAVHSLQEGSLVFSTGFPSVPEDLNIVTDRILSHIAATDVMSSSLTDSNLVNLNRLSRYALWNDTRDVWCVKIDPVWIDFLGARSIGVNRSVPFIDAVPITLWIHGKSNIEENLAERIVIQQESVNNDNNRVDVDSWINGNLNVYPEDNTSVIQMANPFFNVNHKRESNPFVLSASNLLSNSTNTNAKEETRKFESGTITDDKSANIHVIAHFGNLVSIQLDHYQLLFLLRFLEEVNELTTYLTMDSRRITQEMSSKQSVIIGCVLPQCEITLVMPSQTPGKESSGCGDGESVLPDSASLGDDLHTHNSGWHQSLNPFSSIESPSPSKQDKFDFPSTSEARIVTQSSTIKFNIPNSDSPQTTSVIQASSSSSSSTLTIKNKSKNSGDSISIIPKELNTGLNQMRGGFSKGFSKFMNSIDSVLPTNSSFDDGSDTISIQSDFSDESELFVVLGDTTTDGNDFMFKINPDNKLAPVEVASEVCEDPYLTNLSSPSEPSESDSIKRRDLVSMITFRLTTVEIIRHNIGPSSVARLQVAAVQLEECPAIPWDELQTKFGARCRAWNIAPHNTEAPPCIALRFEEQLNLPDDMTSTLEKSTIGNLQTRFLTVRVNDLKLPSIHMSSIVGLTDLIEDELIVAPVPMDVDLENLKIHIIEDRAPVNITSPGPQPIDLEIGKMKVTRDASGVFHIQPMDQSSIQKSQFENFQRKDRDREFLSLQLVLKQLKIDNENMRKQISQNEKTIETHKQKSKQETDTMRNFLKAAQEDCTTLMEEKKTLMDTIKSLQKQLLAIEARNDGKR